MRSLGQKMFKTNIGAFDGKSWEALCQLVFKKKYASAGYQQIQASPGDFGLEGFTLLTGYGFQCYCPEKQYPSKELYETQRDKITRDLGKLKTYQDDIAKRINGTKLHHWVFVTPELDKNSLLTHARTKEAEVRAWNLPIIGDDFRIHLYDAEHYFTEINEIRSTTGLALNFDAIPPALQALNELPEQYEKNVKRKCGLRLAPKAAAINYVQLVDRLHRQTLNNFLEADAFFRRIEESAPVLYFRLLRLINEYENHVIETAATWVGTEDELTVHVRDGLAARVSRELGPEFDETTASQVSRHMVARWLAICQLDYE